jgi:hypothetical protein
VVGTLSAARIGVAKATASPAATMIETSFFIVRLLLKHHPEWWLRENALDRVNWAVTK